MQPADSSSTGLNLAPGSADDGWKMPPPVELADGTRLQLYKDGQALRAAYEAIAAAKHRICLEVYIFASDSTGRAFAELLAKKAAQGVAVFVVVDGWGSFAADRAMFELMRHAGVKLEWFHSVRPWENRYGWRPFLRDHRKMLVVDFDIAGLGGLNIADEYAGPWISRSEKSDSEFWRDTGMGIVGPSSRILLRSFSKTRRYLLRGGHMRATEHHHPLDHTTCDCFGLLASVPTVHSPLRPLLHRFLASAKTSIDMTMAYFAPDDKLFSEFTSAAARGVRVRLMLPAKSDMKLLVAAARFFYDRLISAGVEVYERQHVVLHAKTMLVDERIAVIGSTNLDYRSIDYNFEISAFIRSQAFGQQVQQLFANDMKFANRITQHDLKRRPWIDRVGQWAVSRARYLL